MRYVASISYGKDSLAQLEVIHQNKLPLTDIVTADIMATPEIPAYLPELVEFRNRMDKEIEERYGISVTHVRAEKSFVELFYKPFTERSKCFGDIYGWPPINRHWCMGFLKRTPISGYFKNIECVNWIGIAADEPARFGQLNDKLRSALVEYGITEADAMAICEELGWVSPVYLRQNRDGCWFCPFQALPQLRRLHNEFPEYWRMMMEWDKDCKCTFTPTRSLPEFERRFQMENEGLVPIGKGFKWEMIKPGYAVQTTIYDFLGGTDG